MTLHRVSITINGQQFTAAVEPRLLLVDFIREIAGLTGTHVGCEHGACGACTVIVNEHAVRSCLILAVDADGAEVGTIEGLAPAPGPMHPLQEAFQARHALQCGFCTPGMIMTATDLLRRSPDPTVEEVRHALAGNLCRCTGYQGIVEAVLDAAGRLKEGSS